MVSLFEVLPQLLLPWATLWIPIWKLQRFSLKLREIDDLKDKDGFPIYLKYAKEIFYLY
jgi:hypothetical protein